MPTYATLVKFISQGLGGIGDPEKAYNEGIKMVAQMGIKTIGAYATLGPYDLMLLYEAPDEKVTAGHNRRLRTLPIDNELMRNYAGLPLSFLQFG